MELNYKMAGTGETILVLHGIFGMLDNWQHFAKLLSKNHKVYTLDLRNHGKSPHSDIFNYKIMAEDLIHFMNKHNINKANIMGHSMGGKLAMYLALQYPQYVKKLIVIDIGVKAYPADHNFIFNALCSLELDKYISRQEIESKLFESIPEKRIVQFLLKNIKRDIQSGSFKWKMNLKAIKKNYNFIIAAIEHSRPFTGKSLFIKGEKSSYILEEDKARITKLFPEAKFVTIRNAGHWLHAEQPVKLLSEILKFNSSNN